MSAAAEREDYFTAFELSRRFEVDRAALEKRFYAISRTLHPDRFASEALAGASASEDRRVSLERMSFVNQAYATLKDPAKRREYLLSLEGVIAPKQVPVDLAEAWFELQDEVMDGPGSAAALVEKFESRLAESKESTLGRIAALEKEYDAAKDRNETGREALQKVASETQLLGYFASLERDVARLKGTS